MPERITEGHVCRFCLDSEEDEQNPLIAPCACKGHSRYVHRECLKHWRLTTTVEKNKRLCQLCNAVFESERKWPIELIRIDSSILSYDYASSCTFVWFIQWGLYAYFLSVAILLHYGTGYSSDENSSREIDNYSRFAGLVSTTVLVLLSYAQSVSRTINMRRYLWYIVTNRTSNVYRFQTPYTVVFFATSAYIIYQSYASIGIILYCVMLSKVAPVHRGVLERLNEDGLLVP